MKCDSILACGILSAAMLISAGCGGVSNVPKVADVTGKVTRSGKPVVGVIVTFYPDEKKGTKGPASSGTTNDEGEFELACTGGLKGAVIGHHRVTVVCPQMRSGMDPKEFQANPCKLPKNLSLIDGTPFKVEVSKGGDPVTLEVPEK